MSKYSDILQQYCRDVTSGAIPSCTWHKKAVKRFDKELKRQRDADFLFTYNQGKADRLCSFVESLKPGDMNGNTIHLLPWQVFELCNLEGWVHKVDASRKRFRMAYIEVNRKNGKTTGLLLGLVMYNFLKYKASESYLISSREDLAQKTFHEVRDIVQASPELMEILEFHQNTINFKDITEKSRLGFFTDGGKSADGFRPNFACIDEFHEYPNDKLLTSMTMGMRSKKDAQCVMITTADTEVSVPCYEQNLKSKRILNELQTQDDFFCDIFCLDEGDDFHNESNWIKANPSLYSIIDPSVIQSDIDDAELTPHKMPELMAKTFGIWGGGGEKSWLPVNVWQKNKDIAVDWSTFTDCECTGGLDLAQVDDFCAFTLVFQRDGKNYYKHRFYIPEATVSSRYRKENVNIPAWCKAGIIEVIPGPVIDYNFIIKDILDDAEVYKIKGIGYDRWQSRDVINGIEEERPDIALVEIEQSLKKLSPLTKAYEKQIKEGALVDNNPVMTWMINNVEVRPDPNNNYKPMKKSAASTQHIDGVISSIMAYGMQGIILNTEPVQSLPFDTVLSMF